MRPYQLFGVVPKIFDPDIFFSIEIARLGCHIYNQIHFRASDINISAIIN
jgi:hypothetical protein